MKLPVAPRRKARAQAITLLSWNVNGFRAILRKGFAEVVREAKPDLICLQEIKARLGDMPELADEFPDFNVSFSSAEKAGYSGVALLARKDTIGVPAAILSTWGPAATDYAKEGRIQIAEYQGFSVYNLYFPSGTSGDERQAVKYDFLESLHNHLLQSNSRPKIICGDFNICHKDIDIHHPREAERRKLTGFLPDERAWMDRFAALGFDDTFRKIHPDLAHCYSWWTFRANARAKNLGWRIDYAFVSQTLDSHIVAAELLTTVMGSDHCPVLLKLELPIARVEMI